MARFPFKYNMVDQRGKIVVGGSVVVSETGGSTPATIYESEAGAVISSSTVTTDSSGDFELWVDDGDYSATQRFRLVMSKTGFVTKTIDDVIMFMQGGDVTLTGIQTLTNKTLTSPVLTTPQIDDTSEDHQYIIAVNELTADRTVTLPLLTGNDEFVFKAHTQTLTNKNIGDSTDDTKDIAFTLSGATTAKTLTLVSAHTDDRSITFPNATDTLVGKATTDTLTNKTLTTPTVGDLTNMAHDHSDAASGGLVDYPYIRLHDSKATTTAGGTFTSGAWQKRTVTEDQDTGSNVSVSASVIVLEAGTYDCMIECPAVGVGDHQARLRNTTGTTTILLGINGQADTTEPHITSSTIQGRFTIAASQNVEIQHYCQTTNAGDGFGTANSFGENEIYTVAEFWRIS